MINWQRIEKDKIIIGTSSSSKEWIEAINYYKKTGAIKPETTSEFIFCMLIGLTGSAGMDNIVFIKKDEELKKYIKFCVDSIVNITSQ